MLFYDKAARCGAAVRGRYKYVLNGGCLYADKQHVGWPDDDDNGGEDPPCVGPGAECLFDLEKTRPSAWTSGTAILPSSPRSARCSSTRRSTRRRRACSRRLAIRRLILDSMVGSG